jgi:radial spoke head protein 9
MQLEMAMMNLRSKIDACELHFWGKVAGLTNDYYVCVAVTFKGQYEFPVKNFYWCLSNNFAFKELPTLSEQHDEVIDKDESPFIGDPAKVIESANKAEGEEEEAAAANDEEEDGEDKAQENSEDTDE